MSKREDSMSDQDYKIEKISDAIFGSEDEFDETLARDIAETYEISPEELVQKIKLKMQVEVRRRTQSGDTNTEDLIKAIRSIGSYQKGKSELREPKSLIKKIREGVDTNLRPTFAFRNKTEEGLSENDKQILRELEDEFEGE